MRQFRTTVRAADLPAAQLVINQIRDAYQATPGAMLVNSISLDPLEVIVINGLTSEYYRVPVSVNADGSYAFGQPIAAPGPGSQSYPDPPGTVRPDVPGGSPTLPAPTSSQQASRGVSARDRARIAAAVARGAVPAGRAAHWEAKAARGEDISMVDALTGGLVSPGAGKADAAASQADADYRQLFRPAARHDSPGPEYDALFTTRQAARQMLDQQEAAAQHATASLTEDQLFSSLFGDGGSR
jgi:hypothetical protein